MKKEIDSKLEEPPHNFLEWWYPTRRDPESGADIGGHEEAERVWAKKTQWGWLRRTYGTTARIAWNSQHHRSTYETWVSIGRPEKEPFISLCASNERQLQYYRDLMPIYQWCFVGKSMPKEDNERLVKEMMEKYPGYNPDESDDHAP
jgi:hypothetical protein